MTTKHFVNKAPFDPNATDVLTPEQERYYMATQWQLMWWKLKRHRLAMVSGVILAFMYFSVVISEFLAPYCLLYTSPSPRDGLLSRMPSSA